MRKNLKAHTFSHGDVILCPICQWWRPPQPHCPTPVGEMECIKGKDVGGLLSLGWWKMKRENERMRELGSEEKKEERQFFVKRKKKEEL